MGSLFSRIKALYLSESMKEIALVGLDGAGKTTILYQMKLKSTIETIPTIGFNVETFTVYGTRFNAWDIGGQNELRPLWNSYVESASGIVFVVDLEDNKRWKEAGEALKNVIGEKTHKPVLVLANKADDPKSPELEAKLNNMKNVLDLNSLGVKYGVFHVSAIVIPTNPEPLQRLLPAFEWMATALQKKNIDL